MMFAKSAAVLSATALSLLLAACDTTPPAAAASNQTFERDRPMTGSNIGKRYSTSVPTGTPTPAPASGAQ